MPPSVFTLLLPTHDAAWSLWKPQAQAASEQIESPSEWAGSSKAVLVGLPATACRTLGICLPMAEHDVLHQMVQTHLERLGLLLAGQGARPHRWHLLGQSGGLAQITVDVLADPFPDHLIVDQAADYLAALRLLQLPEGHLVVVEEQSELVVAFGLHGRLFRSHLFAPRGASAEDIGRELKITALSLEATPGLPRVSGVTLMGEGWEAAKISATCGLPVDEVDTLPRSTEMEALTGEPLLPIAVRDLRARRKRLASLTRYSVMGVLLYVALAFLAFAYLRYQQGQLDRLQRQVAATAPAAAEIKKTAAHWKTLSPVLEPSRYPMVLMAEVTGLLPPSGLVIRDFEARIDDIELRGEARDAQVAYQFLEDLQKHRIFSRYELSMPQPSVKEKIASFRIQGKLK